MKSIQVDRWAVVVTSSEAEEGRSQVVWTEGAELALRLRNQAHEAFLEQLRNDPNVEDFETQNYPGRLGGGKRHVKYSLCFRATKATVFFDAYPDPLTCQVFTSGDDPGFKF
jgi:hypothetical protein